MELRHLRYFVAVAEELNFTRAADRLAVSQPPLSAQIRHLEEELGSQLLNRGGRGVTLTSAGKLLLEEARVILKQVDTTKTTVSQRGRTEAGRMILGSAGGTYFHPLVPKIIREFGKKFPETVLTPQASSTALLAARLRTGHVDAAFLRPPVADTNGLALEPIVREPLTVIVPSGHPLAAFDSIPLVGLASETFVMFPRALNPETYDMVIDACRAVGFVPTIGHEAPQVLSIIPLVAAGLGVSIMPSSAAQAFGGEIGRLALEGGSLVAEIHLAYRSRGASNAVKEFVRVARQLAISKARSE